MAASPQRMPFEADGASLLATGIRDQAPALSSYGALARFEFEAGKGNAGTLYRGIYLWPVKSNARRNQNTDGRMERRL